MSFFHIHEIRIFFLNPRSSLLRFQIPPHTWVVLYARFIQWIVGVNCNHNPSPNLHLVTHKWNLVWLLTFWGFPLQIIVYFDVLECKECKFLLRHAGRYSVLRLASQYSEQIQFCTKITQPQSSQLTVLVRQIRQDVNCELTLLPGVH
jgi:hypothetical protein